MQKTLFIGGGNMAQALLGGLIAQGRPSADCGVVEINGETRRTLAERFGVATYDAIATAAEFPADIIVLAVKPQQMAAVAKSLAAYAAGRLVVSIAAGIRCADLSRWLGGHDKLIRAMPNTPALIRAGITGVYAAPAVSPAERAAAEALLEAVGETVAVADEAQMDAVTAVSGSGPAYVFYFLEALERAGVELGFDAATARRLAYATVHGAINLARASDDDPATLREKVTSKGGTTAAGLAAFAANRVADGVVAGVRAAEARGRELGDALAKDADQ